MPTFIIHTQAAWDACRQSFKTSTVKAPESWPVLVSIVPGVTEESEATFTIITPEQATRLIGACPLERFQKIDKGIVHQALKNFKSLITSTQKPKPNKSISYSAMTIDGNVGGFSTTAIYSVGDTVLLNGEEYTITAIGATKIVAQDPIDNQVGTLEIQEDEILTGTIPGLEELPIDPSKASPKHKIADLGNATDHVLDVERAV